MPGYPHPKVEEEIASLRAQAMIYVASWIRVRGCFREIYALGSEEDFPRPIPHNDTGKPIAHGHIYEQTLAKLQGRSHELVAS